MLGIPRADGDQGGQWNPEDQARLHALIDQRQPFLDFIYSRTRPDGGTQYLQVSGEPMFDDSCRFIGFRGIGLDVTARLRAPSPAA
jgi:PAS domain-containing protein